jgi:hypothetical protein
MTSEEFIRFHKDTVLKMNEICKAKNADYAGGEGDAFANFTMVEKMGFATTEQGFLTRMNDKMMRLANFVKNGTLQVKDESVTDTLLDLANYAILMVGYLESKKRGSVTTVSVNMQGDLPNVDNKLNDPDFYKCRICGLLRHHQEASYPCDGGGYCIY